MGSQCGQSASELVGSIALCNEMSGEFSTLSSSAYDTAWVSMIKRMENGSSHYIFPESFEWVKRGQLPDGSWASTYSNVDGILNTLAALLAMKVRQHDNNPFDNHDLDLILRCAKAEVYLQRMLDIWDIESSDRVGFEILVPSLLHLLEKEGCLFEFPARKELFQLGDKKLQRLKSTLTGKSQSTLVHSLEAFVGNLDFDLVKHHQMAGGSMFGSPSSTAAYLMNSSHWDQSAHDYLKKVALYQTETGNDGGFPSAFPTSIFETAWVSSILNSDNLLRINIFRLWQLYWKPVSKRRNLTRRI